MRGDAVVADAKSATAAQLPVIRSRILSSVRVAAVTRLRRHLLEPMMTRWSWRLTIFLSNRARRARDPGPARSSGRENSAVHPWFGSVIRGPSRPPRSSPRIPVGRSGSRCRGEGRRPLASHVEATLDLPRRRESPVQLPVKFALGSFGRETTSSVIGAPVRAHGERRW